MWLEETISPSTSSSGCTASESARRRPAARVALGAVAEAEVLADRDPRRPERLDQHLVDELLRAARGEGGVEGDHDQLLHPERGDQLGLDLQRA